MYSTSGMRWKALNDSPNALCPLGLTKIETILHQSYPSSREICKPTAKPANSWLSAPSYGHFYTRYVPNWFRLTPSHINLPPTVTFCCSPSMVVLQRGPLCLFSALHARSYSSFHFPFISGCCQDPSLLYNTVCSTKVKAKYMVNALSVTSVASSLCVYHSMTK